MGSPARCARILADVRQDIDRFLDPTVEALARREPGAEVREVAAERPEGPEEPVQRRLEVLGLLSESACLQGQLEDSRAEASLLLADAARRAERDAVGLAKLQHERDRLEQDGQAKKRRLSEVESELLRLRVEKAQLKREVEELSDQAREQVEDLKAKAEAERSRLEAELHRLREELVSAAASAATVISPTMQAKALQARVAELEGEVGSLRIALEQAGPERELGDQLRRRHAEYEEELKSSRVVRQELKEARAQVIRLEQDGASLRAALAARSRALEELEDAAHEASAARRDVAAFATVAAAIVAESRSLAPGGEAEGTVSDAAVTNPGPMDLGLAWTRLQGELSAAGRRRAEAERERDQAAQKQRHSEAESRRLQAELASAVARAEELQLDLRRSLDDVAMQKARAEVLREAISKGLGAPAEAPASASVAAVAAELEAAKLQLAAAQRQAADAEAKAEAKDKALAKAEEELRGVRKELAKLGDVEAMAVRLERLNSELWASNRELEKRQEQLEAELKSHAAQEVAGGGTGDFDSKSTKILHLARGPKESPAAEGGAAELSKALAENASLREEIAQLRAAGVAAPGAGDLERQQAIRQLERFKKATKKYVQEFREGIYGILGWKVEMKGEGSSAQWHLTSRFQEGQELVFQLRPAEPGRPAEFDLLGTPWGEQLQDDRQAMAYLEVYSSIPGFLAHITVDLLTQKTFTR